MEGLNYFISAILSLYFDWIFFKNVILDSGADIFGIAMVTILGMPIIMYISFKISKAIIDILSLVLLLFGIDIKPDKKSKSNDDVYDTYEPDWYATRTRAETILQLVDSFKGTSLEYCPAINRIANNIRINMVDASEMKYWCDEMDRTLSTEYRTAVAQTRTGYHYLRSIGAI